MNATPHSTPGAPFFTVICTTKLHQALTSVLCLESLPVALCNYCDGGIKDESEGDPDAAAVDGGHVHGRG